MAKFYHQKVIWLLPPGGMAPGAVPFFPAASVWFAATAPVWVACLLEVWKRSSPEVPSPRQMLVVPPGAWCTFTEVTGVFCSSSVAKGDWTTAAGFFCCCCWALSSQPKLKLLWPPEYYKREGDYQGRDELWLKDGCPFRSPFTY